MKKIYASIFILLFGIMTVEGHQSGFAQQYAALKLRLQAQKRLPFYTKIVDSLAPYWIGTQWDFNGTSEVPREGKIACGYFVTTLLRDAGMPIKRVQTAQKAASEIIKATCHSSTIKRFSDTGALLQFMKKVPDHTLMVIGLDYHVGFVYKKGGKAYFLHSTIYGTRCVINEPIESSPAILASKSYYIGKVNG